MDSGLASGSSTEDSEKLNEDHNQVIGDAAKDLKSPKSVDGSGDKSDIIEEKKDDTSEVVTQEIEPLSGQHLKGLDLKGQLNDVDPNSEDIELKWDDDCDDDEDRAMDDKIPDIIENLELSMPESATDDIGKQTDVEAMDVDITESTVLVTTEKEMETEMIKPVIDCVVADSVSINENKIDILADISTEKSEIDCQNQDLTKSKSAKIFDDALVADHQKEKLSDEIENADLILEAESITNTKISSPAPVSIDQAINNKDNISVDVSDNKNNKADISDINKIQDDIISTEKEENKNKIDSELDLPVDTTDSNSAIALEKEDNFTSKIKDTVDNAIPSKATNIMDSNIVIGSKSLNSTLKSLDNLTVKIDENASQAVTKEIIMKDITESLTDTEEIKTNIEYTSKVIDSDLEIEGKHDETAKSETTEPSTSKSGITETENIKTYITTPEPVASTSTANANKDRMEEVIPSTSTAEVEQMALDTLDEVPEMTDSLGLLAESTRSMKEEDYEDDDADIDGDVDDDEDADADADADDDQDDEGYSNPQTTDHSEDSNAQNSETDAGKDQVTNIQISDVTFSGKLDTKQIEDSELDLDNKEIGDLEDKDQDKDEMEVDDIADVEEPQESTLDIGIESVQSEISGDKTTPVIEKPIDTENAKLSDNSTAVATYDSTNTNSILKNLLDQEGKLPNYSVSPKKDTTQSPSKLKKLEISKAKNVVNYVDLEESSSEDDVQASGAGSAGGAGDAGGAGGGREVTNINLPEDLEVMSASSDAGTEIQTKRGEIVIKGIPKAAPPKTARLNTSEISIKTTTSAPESKMVIPEIGNTRSQELKSPKPKFGLEVFSLDSDEEDETDATKQTKAKSPSPPKTPPRIPSPKIPSPKTPSPKKKSRRCVNPNCSGEAEALLSPDPHVLRYYDVKRKRPYVCQICSEAVYKRTWSLIEGLKSDLPLLKLEMCRSTQELVEISDSDSDSESVTQDSLAPGTALMLEMHLADVLNETWLKYNLDERLQEAKADIDLEMDDLEEQCKEIDAMLKECQMSTDAVRSELYSTFPVRFKQLPPIEVYDTPYIQYAKQIPEVDETEVRRSKRPKQNLNAEVKSHLTSELISDQNNSQTDDAKVVDDDNTDISVVKLSAEAAPAWLPPPPSDSSPLLRPPLTVGANVYAMKHEFGAWFKAKVIEVMQKSSQALSIQQFSVCKVRFEHKGAVALISARHLAYSDPASVRLTIGTRVIALFHHDAGSNKRKAYYSGIIAEMPNPVNSYRYLVFFDDGYAQYVTHGVTRVVCECSSLVWNEVHPFSREFVRQYIHNYPERPMVRLHAGQTIKTEWNGKWWVSKVIKVDASLVQVYFEADNRTEWIYRGSTRLAPLYLELHGADKPRSRPLPRSHNRQNMPYIEYTRPEEQPTIKTETQTTQNQNEEMKRQRAVAKKSTSLPTPAPQPPPHDPQVTSRVVFYTPKAAVRPLKMTSHRCTPRCRRSDVLPLKELRTYNPLARPLLSGWERQIVRFKGRKEIMYRAPCGRRLRSMSETHLYLRLTHSEMSVDLFDFALSTHCLAEFVLNKCYVSKKDLSHGKENVPVPCVNYIDNSLPEFCSYNTERTPTAGVPLNLDPEFLCGCDCDDDCMDKNKCACWKLTLDGARTIGLDGDDVGYVYKRLLDPVPSGIYECNSRCKCKQTCLNRVAQHPLQLKLQVFKTQNRGWGIRALNDIPRGAFLCVYAGNLLTDATANLDGLNEGDEYLAELDYIEVVEQMKEGFEEDVPEADKLLDKNKSESETEDASSSSADEEKQEKNDKEDDDFKPNYEIPQGVLKFNKRLRKRDKRKKEKEQAQTDDAKDKEKRRDEDCITISDDEELREPQSFTAQEGIGGNDLVSKYRSVRAHFGKDEACYIMDAKVQGNIGRYLNHSCQPNVFVQNVFVDTHDPRFPWVAFFALCYIRAGTELTWNYNYDVGSVPGKTLYCHCGAPNCRGRLL